MSRRICVVTGNRADYGLMQWVLHDLKLEPNIELQLLVTGAHLSPEFGSTVRQIEADGFTIAKRVEMLLSSDTPNGIAKSIGLGVIGMSDALADLGPDVAMVLGDRYEILAAAQACLVHNIPLAHIAGGDTTEGAFDESIRHAITKMAHLHFVTNELSARRVRQLGEDPRRIHVVGSPGLDHLHRMTLLDRPALEHALDARLGPRNLLVTFHPVTLDTVRPETQLAELLAALDGLDEETTLWFTRPNADTGGRATSSVLDKWASHRKGRVHVFTSLGQLLYLSLMSHVDAVVGNSSSGLYEAPSFRIGTVDIGDRQRGRLAAASVVRCAPERSAIHRAIEQALQLNCSQVANPYGDGHAAQRIMSVLRDLPPAAELLKKHFYLMETADG